MASNFWECATDYPEYMVPLIAVTVISTTLNFYLYWPKKPVQKLPDDKPEEIEMTCFDRPVHSTDLPTWVVNEYNAAP